MYLSKIGTAGTLESSDIKIIIEAKDNPGIEIDLQSGVIKQFGKQIRKVIEETIKSQGIENAYVRAVDKGAVDFVIKARTLTALYRSAGKEYNFGE
ncbi:MAG: citrate lyase acyl carrier protein [Tissierellaceae bacterium]